jgi:hypothetical protein
LLLVLLAQPGAKQLAIVEARLHQFEDGPPVPASHQFAPGDPIFVSWRISGFEKTSGDHPRIKLEWAVEVTDGAGRQVVEPRTGVVDVELTPQDKNWLPKVRHDFVLPPLMDPGSYKVSLRVTDTLAKASTSRDLPFSIDAPVVEAGDKLVARNFRFLRGENDQEALTRAAYRPGDAVWARFEITGYQFGEGNAYSVAYGLEVLRPNGETVYQEPDAAREKDQTFYPRRYVPGVLNLNLNADLAKGEYTIILRLRDEIGGQTAESRHVFTVE